MTNCAVAGVRALDVLHIELGGRGQALELLDGQTGGLEMRQQERGAPRLLVRPLEGRLAQRGEEALGEAALLMEIAGGGGHLLRI